VKIAINKGYATNLAGVSICLASFLWEGQSELLWSVGTYSVTGSITDSIALYMLFEKVRFVFGSGVIPNRFDDFRRGIRKMILQEFFTVERLQSFLTPAPGENPEDHPLSSTVSGIDYDKMYNKLIEAINESPFGSMVTMMGGAAALEPLRDPIKERMKATVVDLITSGSLGLDPESLRQKVEIVVDRRLAELTPQAVKEIMERMIKEHLGWLIVWGGVIGGIIGFMAHVIPKVLSFA
jgi:uncharacterized membrane protein YheB (UPF0754 family)